MNPPIVEQREFRLVVQVGHPDAECIGLLSQIMDIYSNSTGAKACEPKAVAAWFHEAYGRMSP